MSNRDKIIEVMRDAMFGSVAWSSFWHKDDASKLCEAAFTAYESHLAANGLAVVPVKPTEAMRAAGNREIFNLSSDAVETWTAMLAVSKEETER
jgi:hypothetical protein